MMALPPTLRLFLSRKLFTIFIGAVAALALASGASAGTIDPGVYLLSDHGSGNKGVHYGLRVDDLGDKLFSTELGVAEVLLTWNGGTTATIEGTIHDNDNGDIWDLIYNLSGITSDAGGFDAPTGSGFLTDPNDPLNPIEITGKKNGDGDAFIFRADGHRIDGDNDTPVGRGWLLPDGSTDDFLVRGALVPEPSALLLYSVGVLVAGIAIRRR